MTDTTKREIPWVTIAIAVINVGVFVWEATAADFPPRELQKGSYEILAPTAGWLAEHGGNIGKLTLGQGETWRLLTSMFMHGSLLHIAMNMIGLIDGGRHVEKMYGRAGFIALYLVSGLAGSLASSMRSTNIVSVGASGAIFGVFGAFAAFLLLHRKRLDASFVTTKARGLMLFLVANVWFGLSAQGIDLLAHAGGAIAGFGVGIALEIGTDEGKSSIKRSVLAGLLGVALIFVGARVSGHPDPLIEFGKVETVVNARWQEVIVAAQDGKIKDPEVAKVIDDELIPKWRAARLEYEKHGEGPSDIVRYMRMREDAWELFSDGLKAGDPNTLTKANEKFEAAGALLDSLNK